MINLKVIGCGAAGNKAVCQMVNENYINEKDILLINSNTGDIPEKFLSNSLIYGENSFGGAGKNRSIGKKLLLEDLQNKVSFTERLDKFCTDDTDVICVVASSEGGSGSSALPIMSKYIHEVYGKYVIAVIFFGFEEDVRGLENSINICKELPDDIGVIGISNKKFFDEANGNKVMAERNANEYFIEAITVLAGKTIRPAEQNIDKTDLMKIVTTPGYITVTMCKIDTTVKNKSRFNDAIKLAIDDAKYLDSADRKKCSRMGIIYDLKDPQNSNHVDFGAEVLKDAFGLPYELFTHIQKKKEADEYVSWIITGQELPVEELTRMYAKYKQNSSKLDKDKNAFFESIGELNLSENNNAFENDLESKTGSKNIKEGRSSFFSKLKGEDSLY